MAKAKRKQRYRQQKPQADQQARDLETVRSINAALLAEPVRRRSSQLV